MRYVLRALVVGLAAVLGTAAAVAAAPTCSGTDMMAELATSDPALLAEIRAAAAKTPHGEALLWKVEKPGVAPSYLFGTVHLSDPRVTDFSPTMLSALNGARQVVLEVADLSPQAVAGAMGKAMPLLLDTSGSGLNKVLTPDDYARVQRVLDQSGLPNQIQHMVRPWFVYTLLALPTCERTRTTLGALTVDKKIAELAGKQGQPVAGLESLDEQLAALAGLPADQQVELLKISLKLFDRIDDLTETLVLLYTRRQVAAVWPLNLALARKTGASDNAFKSFENDILTKRNLRMRDGLLPMLDKGGVFAGVGALHIVGPQGLVALLRAAGYAVTPVE